jgi:hypothetical protein
VSGRGRHLAALVAVLAAMAAGAAAAFAGASAFAGATSSAGATTASPASSRYAFAPYVDLTAYPKPNLTAIKRASGIHQATLAFVVAQGTTQCVATWGGYPTDPATGPEAFERNGIRAFTRAGGTATISFGGQAGAELAQVCPTVPALTRAYQAVLSAYHPRRIDFDIEGAAVADPASIDRRSRALAALQRTVKARHHTLKISLTLPVLPSGLTADALAVVRSAVRRHVTLTYVNLMTMDYGDSAAPHPDGQMVTYAIRAARHAHRQLDRLLPHATDRLIGITPMIGINDVATETFTLADAQQLAAAAQTGHYGLLSMWQLERDRQCAQPTTSTQDACSSVAQAPYAFSHALAP